MKGLLGFIGGVGACMVGIGLGNYFFWDEHKNPAYLGGAAVGLVIFIAASAGRAKLSKPRGGPDRNA